MWYSAASIGCCNVNTTVWLSVAVTDSTGSVPSTLITGLGPSAANSPSPRLRLKLNTTSSATSSRPFTGSLSCHFTPLRMLSTIVVASSCSQLSASLPVYCGRFGIAPAKANSSLGSPQSPPPILSRTILVGWMTERKCHMSACSVCQPGWNRLVMVPPYSGALIISPVVGSSTISFSIAAAGASSLAGLAHPPVAARTNPSSAATGSLQFRIMRFPPKPCVS